MTPANKINIAVSSSGIYAKYLGAYIQSIKNTISTENNYELFIFEHDINDATKRTILSMVTGVKNLAITFIDPTEVLKDFSFNIPKEYAQECFFRLAAPILLKDLEKLIFTDLDLIFQHDPSELYNIDISGYPLGACKDLMFGSFLKHPDYDWLEYATNTLQLDEPFMYFNTGVLLLNIQEFNKHKYSEQLLKLAHKSNYRILEQDILNMFFKTNIKYVDTAWNFAILNKYYKTIYKYMPDDFKHQYESDQQKPLVIHWAGGRKPWDYCDECYANLWWQLERLSPFYADMLTDRKERPSVKIFVSYKDKHKLLTSNIITPIQSGRAITDEVFTDMIGDDTGDNISAKNLKYNELCVQYWAWKNYELIGNPDWIGFMHYRRHFIFDDWVGNEHNTWLPNSKMYMVPYINNDYMRHLHDDSIYARLNGADIIVLKPYDLKNIGKSTIRSQFKHLHENVEHFDTFIEICKRLYPEYTNAVQKIENETVQYLCNMFVMRKDLFFEYCDFCFSVLEEVEKEIDTTGMDVQSLRFCGFFGEFLLSMFIFHKKATADNIRILELNGSFILNDDAIKYPLIKYVYYKICSKIIFTKNLRKRMKTRRQLLKQYISCIS